MVVCRRAIDQRVLQQGVPIVSVAHPLLHVIASMHCNAQQVTSCSALTNQLVRLGCAVVLDGLHVVL